MNAITGNIKYMQKENNKIRPLSIESIISINIKLSLKEQFVKN